MKRITARIAAYAFAVFGLALLVWTVSKRGAGAAAPGPPPAEPIQDAAMPPRLTYCELTDVEAAHNAMNDFRNRIASIAHSHQDILALGGSAAEALAQAATQALGPIVTGSFEEYLASVHAFGGDASNLDSHANVGWELKQKRFMLRPISPENAHLRAFKPADAHGRLGASARDAAARGYLSASSTRVPDRYPSADITSGRPMFEVRLPLLARSRTPLG